MRMGFKLVFPVGLLMAGGAAGRAGRMAQKGCSLGWGPKCPLSNICGMITAAVSDPKGDSFREVLDRMTRSVRSHLL